MSRHAAEGLKMRSFISSHPALVISGLVVALSVARVYYFSSFNLATARAVLSVANQVTIATSTILGLLAAIVPVLVFIPQSRRWLFAGNNVGAPLSTKLRTALIWMSLAPAIFAVLSPLILGGYLLGGLAIWLIERRGARQLARADATAKPAAGAGVDRLMWLWATLVGFVVLLTMIGPWQPKERIVYGQDGAEITGYIMGEGAGMLLILDDRKVPYWIDVAALTERTVCGPEEGSLLVTRFTDMGSSKDWQTCEEPDVAKMHVRVRAGGA